MNELQSDELEATTLETADDVTDESPLDTVRLERQRRNDQHDQISGEGKADRVP